MRHQQGATKAIRHHIKKTALSIIILLTIIAAGCSDTQLPGFTDSLDDNPSPIQVLETMPPEDAEGVALNTYIQAIFNTTIDPSSLTDSSLVIRQNNIIIEGSLSSRDSALTFYPANELQRNQTIIATISSAIADTQGNTMDQNFEWNFTTRPPTAEERTPPSIASTNPEHRAVDIPFNTNISARFSKALNPETINNSTFYLQNNNSSIVSGSVSYADSIATFIPSGSLQEAIEYRVTITNDIEDMFGNSPEQNYTWNFRTKEIDRDPPRIVSTNPKDNEHNVDDDITITATFNEPMDHETFNQETFRLYARYRWGFRQLSGSVSYAENTAQFTPHQDLREKEDYIAVIDESVTDLAGNKLGENYRWSFETEDD